MYPYAFSCYIMKLITDDSLYYFVSVSLFLVAQIVIGVYYWYVEFYSAVIYGLDYLGTG